ncbi:hypothetical protein IMCC21906_00206 [Spongiibacter sp. IMCC21906]|uniref:hypothetical protein n=1 Tax=Spongiibacter sp. IMCC21906 TaxID=1620392 RepID=UPI00062DF59A|nr:hypothetical protein [Spongiibacter sp. IMCC21906]AKH67899.1 hypothetical protein IMCC21906_00206 [Spongiibacter sp. IMCC21906]
MLDPGSPDGVRDDDKYVRLVFTNRLRIPQVRAGDVYVILIIENRRCIPQMGVGNAYIQYSLITSSYRL